MSRDEHRARIPTSEELQRQGVVPPIGADSPGKRRRLLGIFRVGRIHVSGDVAARKYVPTQRRPERPSPEPSAAQFPAEVPTPPTSTTDASPLQTFGPLAEGIEQAAAFRPRRIRIDPSVRERRGLGQPGHRPLP